MLVFKDLLFVRLVDSSRWRPVELLSVLLSELCVLGFLSIQSLFTLRDHIHVQLLELFGASDGLAEVLRRPLLLELLYLGPDIVRHIVGGSE